MNNISKKQQTTICISYLYKLNFLYQKYFLFFNKVFFYNISVAWYLQTMQQYCQYNTKDITKKKLHIYNYKIIQKNQMQTITICMWFTSSKDTSMREISNLQLQQYYIYGIICFLKLIHILQNLFYLLTSNSKSAEEYILLYPSN